jgi:hypothetical protein
VNLNFYCLGPAGGVVAGGVDVAGGVVVGPIVRSAIGRFVPAFQSLEKIMALTPIATARAMRIGVMRVERTVWIADPGAARVRRSAGTLQQLRRYAPWCAVFLQQSRCQRWQP